MTDGQEPSYTELVHEVLIAAGRPMTFQEVFDAVSLRRSVTTRSPKRTIRHILTQGSQLIGLGDGHYGFLPQLMRGSMVRLSLTEEVPVDHPLIYPDEVRHALWPSFFEIQKRQDRRPATVQLPNGDEIALTLEFVGRGTWGSRVPDGLRRYLLDSNAAAGDSLLIRVVDGEAGRYEARFESRLARDNAAVAKRNQALADNSYQVLRTRQSIEVPIWEIVALLLGRGIYLADVAPDSLHEVLSADSRFVYGGISSWILAEFVTAEEEELIRRRMWLEQDLLDPADVTGALPDVDVDAPVFPRSLEGMIADLGALLSKQQFASIDEANAFLQEVLAGGDLPHRSETPLEQAQDVIYEAWQSPTRRRRIRLARQALEISPDCADAYVLLAEETAHNPAEAAGLYRQGVAAGERALGAEAFQQDAGYFWGIIETRPYMRARAGLAQALWATGERREAIQHLWDMLGLNPGDNQGIRYLLLGWLLETNDNAQVTRLLDLYKDDVAAAWLYGRALHTFSVEGDSRRARNALARAEAGNPHVPTYLLGRTRMPSVLPETMGFGDESEAIICAAEQMTAWRDTPGALEWLDRRSK